MATSHLEADSEMRIVVEIRASRHDPVDKTGLDQRYDARNPETRWSQSSGQCKANGDFVAQHSLLE
jgi:hypothetical protein